MLIFEIAAGVLLGGILLAMFIFAMYRARTVYTPQDEANAPWWMYAGLIVPPLFLATAIISTDQNSASDTVSYEGWTIERLDTAPVEAEAQKRRRYNPETGKIEPTQ